MIDRKVIIYPTADVLREALASRFLLKISDRLAKRQRVDVALTGGTDGIAMLRTVASSPLSTAVDWSRVHLWWGDERFVPEDDPDRNARQAREAWFGELVKNGQMPESHIHEMPADTRSEEELANATEEDNYDVVTKAAKSYEHEIVKALGKKQAFDIALFGVGPDGHFASLFPNHPVLRSHDKKTRVIGITDSPKLPPMRISLTVPFIRRCRRVWVFASSPRKAEAVGKALDGYNNPHVPSSFAGGDKETLWLLDRDAAADIK
ncbi:6-phosphogluconolactonase [Bifidobacterium catulorum]|uniref:6-phosphogluconolactonase n=1 Tax=Bifidobacterium catulorum TaxID=1630173 RepID=A0A2U2MPX7_9BIFI|nr:6-phosphogluconolactonase [Bifidobacterium catulorum]PWG58900.1 6-phosphogluconolactonase [Bifidobacterium catulorum]